MGDHQNNRDMCAGARQKRKFILHQKRVGQYQRCVDPENGSHQNNHGSSMTKQRTTLSNTDVQRYDVSSQVSTQAMEYTMTAELEGRRQTHRTPLSDISSAFNISGNNMLSTNSNVNSQPNSQLSLGQENKRVIYANPSSANPENKILEMNGNMLNRHDLHNHYTLSSSSHHAQHNKRRLIDVTSSGFNLISRLDDMIGTVKNTNDSSIGNGQTSSSCSNNMSNARFGFPLKSGRHVIRNNQYVSHTQSNSEPEIDSITGLNDAEGSILSSDEDDSSTYDSDIYFQDSDIDHDSSSDDYGIDENVNDQVLEQHNTAYIDIGDPNFTCKHCGACMWYAERTKKDKNTSNPKFHLCCSGGKVQLPLLTKPPNVLNHLLFNVNAPKSKNFQQNIRAYNMMFAFTSPGIKIDRSFNKGRGPPTFRIQGQSCHLIGSLLPLPGNPPKFGQLYIYDTENEIQNRLEGSRCQERLDPQIVTALKSMLDKHNVFAKSWRMAKERHEGSTVTDLKLRLICDRNTDGRIYNLPSVSDVAALIVGDVDTSSSRDIILQKQSGQLKRINERHPAYLALQYPLLFPYGEDGYRGDVRHRETAATQKTKKNRVTIREFLCFRILTRRNEPKTLLAARRLFQQFIVDGYCMMESQRLHFVRTHQKELRVEKYINLQETNHHIQVQGSKKGKRIILPSTFVGSRRYMEQLYYDGMAICGAIGFPDLFLTFTCNPNWPEIQRELRSMHLNAQDRPDIVSRIFKIKLDQLMTDLKKNRILGKVIGYIYTIEFQKRGLPHAHILIFLHPSCKYPNPEDIDKIISAEIPDKQAEKELYELVKNHMLHGPCGNANKHAPCMQDGKCSRYYPKNFQSTTIVDQDGYPLYRRKNNGNVIQKNGIIFDNRHVVPYNSKLLLRYQAHLNIEWCNQCTSIKYLFKYIHKGYDRITASIVPTQTEDGSEVEVVDEIKQYLDCRYISASEACWRIFAFPIHSRSPAVERLYFHLPNEHPVYFDDDEDIDSLLSKESVKQSMFTSWMEANKIYDEGRTLTYPQFVSKFVYVPQQRRWKPRKKGYTIGRLNWVPPSTGELFYLRMMLSVVKGPCSFEDIRTIGQTQYPNFREACFAMGFLNDDREYIEAIREANDWGSGQYLRKLFVTILLSNTVSRPEQIWEKTWQWLADGFLYEQRRLSNIRDLQLSDSELQNLTLLQIEELLQSNRKSLRDFPSMPFPQGTITSQLGNKLIYAERNYDKVALHNEFQELFNSLTDEQRKIFETIMKAVDDECGGIFFLYGYGGTGKTFVWRTLSSALRSRGDIVLTVASSGIASLLLPGGRTAHSKFAIPVPAFENSTCNIHQGSELAELLKIAKLIIWDEAPMAHKYCFEALDKTLQDIVGQKAPFGGKVVVFGGDFRQILPVIPRGSRSDIINATINSSYIWDYCQVLRLTKNMRLQNRDSNSSTEELKQFSNWLLDVGDGKIGEPNDGYAEIDIPDSFLITDFHDPIAAIVQSTYGDLVNQYNKENYLQSRAILASTVEVVDQINDYVLSLIPGDEKDYLSSDSVDQCGSLENQILDGLAPEFLNTLRTSGLPNHKIKLKVGTPVMLLRNLDQSEGLCNGTRLVVTRLADHVIEAKIVSGKNIGNLILIPRMSLSPSQSPWPFKLIRRQFPLIVSFAMTINKSQGQSLSNVGLYLPKPVFSHGQLYVALSRVQSKKGLKILIHDNDNRPLKTTTNVVFKEVFQNI